MADLARLVFALSVAAPVVLAASAGCSDDTSGGNTTTSSGHGATSGTTTNAGGASAGGAPAGGAGGTGAGSGTSTSTSTAVGGGPTEIAKCQNHVYECGDLVDNDGDGLVDSDDPDCLGPCDNTEDGFYGGIPGQSGPACTVDCYFDQDSGAGNDDCHWNHKCDPHEVAPDYHPENINGTQCAYDPNANTPGTGSSCDELYNTQSQTCYDYCGPLTPNGCDCFGCCELPAGGGKYVWLGSEDANGGSCSLAVLDDPSKCEPCLPVKACLNDCKTCELCIGKTTLPPECNNPDGGTPTGSGGAGGGGNNGQCGGGLQPCGLAGQEPCAAGFYCITGCCVELPN